MEAVAEAFSDIAAAAGETFDEVARRMRAGSEAVANHAFSLAGNSEGWWRGYEDAREGLRCPLSMLADAEYAKGHAQGATVGVRPPPKR